ncbi:MarR family winged helix-turn-helix transcriptional regulator [Pyxidicoccus fallax]|nr:MarR family transcriptional regulator [Pyxidicoccus fallax]
MQLLALKVIAGGVASQAMLADRLSVDAPAASRLVDRLEEDGLVIRRAGENRRCLKLELTEKAQGEVQLLRDALQWMDGELCHYLEEAEVTELKRLLGKLQDGLLRAAEGTAPSAYGVDD